MKQKILLALLVFPILFSSSCSSGFRSRKSITIGIDSAFFGNNVGNKRGLIYAFLLDLFESTFDAKHYHVNYYELSFGATLDALEDKSCDFVVSSLPINIETENLYSFSNPIIPLGDVFVTRKEMSLNFKDYDGKIIAIPHNFSLNALFVDYPSIKLTYYTLVPNVLTKIVTYQLDGALIPYFSLSTHLSTQVSPHIRISKKMYTDDALRLVSVKGSHKRDLKAFNKHLKQSRDNGTYDKLFEKWNLSI